MIQYSFYIYIYIYIYIYKRNAFFLRFHLIQYYITISLCLSTYLPVCMSIYLSVCLSVICCILMSVHLISCLVCLSIYPSKETYLCSSVRFLKYKCTHRLLSLISWWHLTTLQNTDKSMMQWDETNGTEVKRSKTQYMGSGSISEVHLVIIKLQ